MTVNNKKTEFTRRRGASGQAGGLSVVTAAPRALMFSSIGDRCALTVTRA